MLNAAALNESTLALLENGQLALLPCCSDLELAFVAQILSVLGVAQHGRPTITALGLANDSAIPLSKSRPYVVEELAS